MLVNEADEAPLDDQAPIATLDDVNPIAQPDKLPLGSPRTEYAAYTED